MPGVGLLFPCVHLSPLVAHRGWGGYQGAVAVGEGAESDGGDGGGSNKKEKKKKKRKKRKSMFSWGNSEEEKNKADEAAAKIQAQFRGVKDRQKVRDPCEVLKSARTVSYTYPALMFLSSITPLFYPSVAASVLPWRRRCRAYLCAFMSLFTKRWRRSLRAFRGARGASTRSSSRARARARATRCALNGRLGVPQTPAATRLRWLHALALRVTALCARIRVSCEIKWGGPTLELTAILFSLLHVSLLNYTLYFFSILYLKNRRGEDQGLASLAHAEPDADRRDALQARGARHRADLLR